MKVYVLVAVDDTYNAAGHAIAVYDNVDDAIIQAFKAKRDDLDVMEMHVGIRPALYRPERVLKLRNGEPVRD